jgi:hypothetical protein
VPSQLVFAMSVILSFVAWGVVTRLYIWPALRNRSRVDALRPLLVLHSFRFVGLAFLIPGVVSPELPAAFAGPAAYGDLVAAILALLAMATLRTGLGTVVCWAFNVWGAADLLHAFYQGNRTGVDVAPGLLGATFFIPTVVVPLLLITHGLVFRLLVPSRRRQGEG